MTSSPRIRDVAAAALACATVAAAIETGVAAFRKLALHRITFLSFDFPWMTPVAFGILVVPAAVLVAIAFRALRRPLSLAAIVGILGGVLTFSFLLPYSSIAWWASALIGTGVGTQLSRALAAKPAAKWLRSVRVLTILLLTVMAAGGLAARGSRMLAERRGPARPAAPAGAPNVLIIVLDTVRAANLSLYGYDRPTTPVLDRLAGESIVFDFASATTSWSLPSHGSMFTGRTPGELGGNWLTPIGKGSATLAEVLSAHGYATAGFAANLIYTSYESGLDRGFGHYDDYRVSWPMVMRHSSLAQIDVKSNLPYARSLSAAWDALKGTRVVADGFGRKPADMRRSAQEIAESFLDWQAEQGGRPFFAFLNMFDAHGPYYAPPRFRSKFANVGQDVQKYDAAIAWEDEVVGTLLATCRQRGLLDHTVVVVTSDHGQLFGEHGLRGHSNGLYWRHLNVPLLIRYPAVVPAGRRVPQLVSLQDLPATILDLAGIAKTGIGGASLAGTWSGAARAGAGAFAELSQGINVAPGFRNRDGAMIAWLDERFHYIRDGIGKEELYEYRRDPAETQDLAGDPAFRADLKRMRDAAVLAAGRSVPAGTR